MLRVRRSEDRGRADLGWLDSRHSFSFGEYYDPQHMGHGALRVLNDDRVAPARGFPSHPHRDMEIVSYVLSGALEHKDSLGTGSVIRPGDVQRMSAGTGVVHSELNPSQDEPVHFLQIWLTPSHGALPPSYEQKHFTQDERSGRLRLIASGDARDGSVLLHQDADLYAALLAPQQRVQHALRPGRRGYVHVARGALSLGETQLQEGDGVAIDGESSLTLTAQTESEVLVFDLA